MSNARPRRVSMRTSSSRSTSSCSSGRWRGPSSPPPKPDSPAATLSCAARRSGPAPAGATRASHRQLDRATEPLRGSGALSHVDLEAAGLECGFQIAADEAERLNGNAPAQRAALKRFERDALPTLEHQHRLGHARHQITHEEKHDGLPGRVAAVLHDDRDCETVAAAHAARAALKLL